MEILAFHMYDLPWLVDLIFYCQYDYNPCQCFNNRTGITDSFPQHSQLMTHKKSRRQYIYQWKANYSLYRILIFIDWNIEITHQKIIYSMRNCKFEKKTKSSLYWKWVFSSVLRVIKPRRRPRFSQVKMMIKRIFVTKNFGLCVEGRVHEIKIYSKWVHYQPFLMHSKNHFAVKKQSRQ
jgi:hypothetical protein